MTNVIRNLKLARGRLDIILRSKATAPFAVFTMNELAPFYSSILESAITLDEDLDPIDSSEADVQAALDTIENRVVRYRDAKAAREAAGDQAAIEAHAAAVMHAHDVRHERRS